MGQSIKGAGSGEMGKHWGSSSWVMVFHGAGAEVAPGRGAGGSPSPPPVRNVAQKGVRINCVPWETSNHFDFLV